MFQPDQIVNVKFPVTPLGKSRTIPYYHGYRLFGSLISRWPAIHGQEANWLQVNRITGTYKQNNHDGELLLDDHSHLLIRLPASKVKESLVLAHQALTLADEYQSTNIVLGKPAISPIRPSANLYSWCVSFKIHAEGHYIDQRGNRRSKDLWTRKITKEDFKLALLRKLFQHQINCRANTLEILEDRHTFWIKGNELCGYPIILSKLSDQESLTIQSNGIGGRRHMGCGFFVPLSTE